MNQEIHSAIYSKLDYFLEKKKIPNIIFHGPSGSGKRTIVKNFINSIYGEKTERIKSYVMYVNCAHGKGIKFIREELKFFAKTHINNHSGNVFKSIIMMNADKLTIDAQSALRRCIELFNHTTRFFIIVEDKYKLLKPILSRFCELYIPEPVINGKKTNLHTYNLRIAFNFDKEKKQRVNWLKKTLDKPKHPISADNISDLSVKLYEKCYSGLDLMNYVENSTMVEERKYQLLLCFNKVRREFRNERLFMLFILNFTFIRSDYNLENISFM